MLRREIENLKLQTSSVNSSANDQMINLRNEVETLKAKLRVEQDARKTAQGVSKELQMKLDRLRIKVAQKKAKFEIKDLEEIQKRYREESQADLENKLAQVNQFLHEQQMRNEKLDRLKAENYQNDLKYQVKRIAELEAENARYRDNSFGIEYEKNSKYKDLYRQETSAREKADNESSQMRKRLMEIEDRLATSERRNNLSQTYLNQSFGGNTSGYGTSRYDTHRLNSSLLSASLPLDTTLRRMSPDLLSTQGLYSRVADAVSRAEMDSNVRASPLRRI